MLDHEKIRAWRSGDVRHTYTSKDTILYALGLGVGADPLDEKQLRFIYEQRDLVALPTLAAVLASPGAWMRERKELGIDFLKLVHGEQSVQLHAPLPAAATLIGRSRVVRLVDKGEGKGAVMHVEKQLIDEATQQHIATCEQVLFLRGNGGFATNGGGDEPAPAAPATPDTPPDQVRRAADAGRPGRAVPPVGRPEPAAHRSGRRRQGGFPGPSCMGSPPTASPATASSRPSATTTRRGSSPSARACRRRSTRAKRCASNAGASATRLHFAAASSNATWWC